MKVEVKQISSVEKTLDIEVEPKRYNPTLNRIINDLARKVQIPGFRKGKAPAAVIIRKVGIESLKQDLFKELIPEISLEAMQEQNIEPIALPTVRNFDQIYFENGKPIKFQILVEVKPEFELEGYKGLTLEKKPRTVDVDELIEKRIQAMREQAGQMEPMEEDRGLVKGDVAHVDFHSFLNGEPVEQGSATDYYMDMNDGHFIPGFLDHLEGKKTGDEWEFDITFPEDYMNKTLAGNEVHFKIKLHGIMKKTLPELDDEFAKGAGNYDTFGGMKQALKDEIEEALTEQEKQFLQEQIIDQLIKQKKDLLVPPSLVDNHLNVFLRNMEYQLSMMGKKLDDYLKEQNTNIQDMKRRFFPQGVEMAKAELILDKLAQLEDIKVTDEDLEKEIAKIAKRMNHDVEMVKKAMEKDGQLDNVKFTLRNRKIYDMIIDNANLVDKVEEEKKEETGEKAPEKAEGESSGEKTAVETPKAEEKSEAPVEEKQEENKE